MHLQIFHNFLYGLPEDTRKQVVAASELTHVLTDQALHIFFIIQTVNWNKVDNCWFTI